MIGKMVRAVLQAGRAVRVGRDDAKAAIAEPEFLTTMELIETLPPQSRELIALGVEHELTEKLREQCRKYLPPHNHQDKDYLQFVGSGSLARLAEGYFSMARRVIQTADMTPDGPGIALVATFELVGYYLLSRSWGDFDHGISIDAPGLGSGVIGVGIERRIGELLRKHGRALPR
jgi:hypothetical protein